MIYYPDPWPGAGLICLGSGIAHGRGGNVAIWGRKNLGTDLPVPIEGYDANAKAISPSGAVGAKIWLVLSNNVYCGTEGTLPDSKPDSEMKGWNPSAYLFEFNLITYYYYHAEGDDSCRKKK